jgi:hypothetical protein
MHLVTKEVIHDAPVKDAFEMVYHYAGSVVSDEEYDDHEILQLRLFPEAKLKFTKPLDEEDEVLIARLLLQLSHHDENGFVLERISEPPRVHFKPKKFAIKKQKKKEPKRKKEVRSPNACAEHKRKVNYGISIIQPDIYVWF